MTPAALVAAVRAAGVQLFPRDGQIILRPAGALQPDLRAALVESKPEVLAHLATVCTLGRNDSAPCPACGYVHGSLNQSEPCTRCGSESWTVSLVDGRGVGRTCAACIAATAAEPRGAA